MPPLLKKLRPLLKSFTNALAVVAVCVISVVAIAAWVLDPIAIQNLRLAQFDQMQRWFPRTYVPVPVRVVDIDEASLKKFGQWPWPRTRLAELTNRLHDAGAAVVAFDILLIEPDRTSPAAMSALWNQTEVSKALKLLPDHDAVLAGSFKDANVVLGAGLSRTGVAGNSITTPAISNPPYRIITIGSGAAVPWLSRFDASVLPLPILKNQANGLGALNFSADADGVVRRVPLLVGLGDQVVPSLSAEALRIGQGSPSYAVRTNDAGVQDLRIGNLTVATNSKAEIWLHYTKPQPERYVSAADVLDRKVSAELLDGNIVLIGSSAAGLMDLRFSPMGEIMPGVQAHALALEQMLLGQHLDRPSWVSGLEALLVAVGTLLGGLYSLIASARRTVLAVLMVLASLIGGACYLFVVHHLLLDALYPSLVISLSFVLGSTIHHWVTENEQRWVRQAFSRYVSPNRVAHLVEHHDQLELGGQRQVCSFVFTDLADFTRLMESGDPAAAVTQLNEYLDGMLAIVFKHEGTVDRIVGDAVAVLFSAPVAQPDHQQRAMNCALDMERFAASYAEKLQATGVKWGHTRIGIHCGEVIVGNFGGKTLFDYRALGDPINTASRLESVNKHLGTRMCASADLLQGCTGIEARLVGKLVLQGKVKPLEVWEPLTAKQKERYAPTEHYQAAMALLRSEPSESKTPPEIMNAFQKLAEQYPEDPLVKLHCQRLQEGATDDLIVMQSK